MPAHGQMITWGMHIGRSTQDVRGHWLQRIRQWLTDRPAGNKEAPMMTLDGSWDKRRERFQSPCTESALEHAAGHGGQSWLITMHSAAVYAWWRLASAHTRGSAA
jgi:hypothetical protein